MSSLSPRDIRMLQLLASGHTQQQAARRLGIELTKRTRTINTPTGPTERTEAVYVVTTSTGYRAELVACDRDECTRDDGPLRSGQQRICPKPGRHTEEKRHNRDYCHNWHDESVETFAKQVLATYGAKPKPTSGAVGVPKGSKIVRRSMFTIPGWPDPEARAW